MKKMAIIGLLATLIISACSTTQQANASLTTETISVKGVCEMCKKRIETAAYGVSGVKTATWNIDKQALVVSYDAQKTSNDVIQKRVAMAGYDTEKVKASDKSYSGLPNCCRYRDGVEAH